MVRHSEKAMNTDNVHSECVYSICACVACQLLGVWEHAPRTFRKILLSEVESQGTFYLSNMPIKWQWKFPRYAQDYNSYNIYKWLAIYIQWSYYLAIYKELVSYLCTVFNQKTLAIVTNAAIVKPSPSPFFKPCISAGKLY